jgi:hypothetical protein
MKLASAVLALLLSCAAAAADGLPQEAPHLALHNGSVVQIVPNPNGHITITYVRPRIGLLPLVQPGAVLLVGQWRGDRLEATVYGSNPCGFIPYPVAGSVNRDGLLTLVGPPLIDSYTLFDFSVPSTRDITETVSLLARMARFIIADLTDPSSIPKELEAIVPQLAVPVQPLLEGAARPYAMFKDYWKYG